MSTRKVKEIIKRGGVDMNLYYRRKNNTKTTIVREQSGVFQDRQISKEPQS